MIIFYQKMKNLELSLKILWKLILLQKEIIKKKAFKKCCEDFYINTNKRLMKKTKIIDCFYHSEKK